MIERFDSRIISWKNLSKLIENKYVKNNYIFLIIVPIIAKVLSEIPDPLIVNIDKTSFHLVINLPFSWKLFFFSAVLFTISSVLFQIFCPKIIFENHSFTEFKESGKRFSHLYDYIENIGISIPWLLRLERKKFPKFESVFTPPSHIWHLQWHESVNSFADKHKISLTKGEIEKLELFKHLRNEDYNWQEFFKEPFGNNLSEENRLSRVFWNIYNYANIYNISVRIICLILVLLGYSFLVYVFIQNIIFVTESF